MTDLFFRRYLVDFFRMEVFSGDGLVSIQEDFEPSWIDKLKRLD